MAKDAVDAAVHDLGRTRARRPAPRTCRCSAPTATTALWNGRGPGSPSAPGCGVSQVEHLLNRYGSLVHELLALIDDRPEPGRAARTRRRSTSRSRRSTPPRTRVRCTSTTSWPAGPGSRIETWDRGVGAAAEVAAPGRPGARLGRRRRRARGRALPQAGGRRTGVPAPARRPLRRRRAARRPGRPDGPAVLSASLRPVRTQRTFAPHTKDRSLGGDPGRSDEAEDRQHAVESSRPSRPGLPRAAPGRLRGRLRRTSPGPSCRSTTSRPTGSTVWPRRTPTAPPCG